MICTVIPIKRLPRRFTHFDYRVPTELRDTVRIGQLVRIPFKSSDIFGLVFSLRETKESDSSALKDLASIVHPTPILSHEHLRTLTTLSSWYGVSTGTLAKMMLLPLQKRKLKTINLREINDTDKQENNHTLFVQYTSEIEHKQLLQELIHKSTTQQIVIIVPEVHHIGDTLSLLDEQHAKHATTWHSGLSTKEQFERWLQVRNGEKHIVIGTRGAILLPYYNLGKIVIDYEQYANHKHWDQAPRFHVKDIAELLRTSQGTEVTLMSYAPSVETYFRIHKGQYTSPSMDIEATPGCTVVNLSHEQKAGNYSPISDTLAQALSTLKGNAFLHLNRLGIATYIGCNECGWRALCPQCTLPQILHTKNKQLTCHYCNITSPLPQICPKCKAHIVTLGGVGTETVEDYIKKLVSTHALPHEVIRIDSQTKEQVHIPEHQHIVIGTDTAIPYISWSTTDIIALLDIDKQLAIPEFQAEEVLWQTLQEILYKKNSDAQLLIQTRDPRHLVLKSLAEPDRFYRTDLNHRMTLHYPPYSYLVRYFYGHANLQEAKKIMETSVTVLKNRLTEQKKDIILSDSFDMHPHYFRGRYWFAILARLNTTSWQDDLVWLNTHIPETWKIDPNPISILSP